MSQPTSNLPHVGSALKIGTVTAFIVMILTNAAANLLPLNGVLTGAVSDRYANLFAPAPVTFSIWGVIYLLLGAFVFYTLAPQRAGSRVSAATRRTVAQLFLVSSAANTAWIFAWHYDAIGLSVLLMLVILASVGSAASALAKAKPQGLEYVTMRLPFSVYFGWITVATVANVAAYLVYSGWRGWSIAPEVWATLIVIIAAGIGLFGTMRLKDPAYGIVLLWAYAGILIEHTSVSGWASAFPLVGNAVVGCLVALTVTVVYSAFEASGVCLLDEHDAKRREGTEPGGTAVIPVEHQRLAEKLEALQMLNDELIEQRQRDDALEFAWSGNLGHWYWNIKSNEVIFNPMKVQSLGYSIDELPEQVGFEFFTDRLHPDDYEPVMDNMRKHMRAEIPVYEVEYRIKTADGGWKWFYDRGKVTRRTPEGAPLFASGIVFDISERKEREESIELMNAVLTEESTTDPLTGVLNRRGLLGELNKRLHESIARKLPLAIAMFDIDDFKHVNDTYGHVFGDHVITEVARLMSETVRGLDSVGRFGGEEFLVILPNTALPNAQAVCDRINAAVEEASFGDGAVITVSGGLVEFSGQTITDLIQEADQLLYKAKRAGKNRVVS